ncbi:uncharacterized protein N7496_005132 [Penicillium cataractarum]|uniref:Vacuolar ATPase assembly protein VMA22 n=1 Tax=Penicillium cataractarum TaxID=2100454 RepID=A0A9W9VD50_9EURO|nr:uncharacterized protein N7496_005132 [Penicillium cataractarum]KAJ5377723.1 hypothetical protein N7496_005132 [Penicillium cataractarum]
MAQIPTPPPSRPGSEAPDPVPKPAEASSELLQSLDVLLEEYLHLLDRQQKLQSGLAKQLSSGFLSLAHANYTCPPGRRYGADYYDERMKATRKISIHAQSEVDDPEHTSEEQDEVDSCRPDELEYKFNLEKVDNRPAEENTDDTATDAKDKPSTEATEPEVSTNDATTPASEAGAPPSQDSDAEPPAPQETKKVRKKFRSDDPIYWYGILVPPSLRTAQKSFTEAIQTQVPDLAGTIVEMRALEQKITQVRGKLGIDNSETTSIE